MDQADEGHWKELMRLVKNVSLSRNKQLSIFPNIGEQQNLNVFTDLDYCDDRDKRRSIPGYDIFCNEHQLHGNQTGRSVLPYEEQRLNMLQLVTL
jgi:hypothetical protein